jgi:SAM-dependent methyltransferase
MERDMRGTWDALAAGDTATFVGDPDRGRTELDGLFGRLGGDPRGGVAVEVGCGPGRMTAALAERFDRVLALDVSPAMLERARAAVTSERVEFLEIPGETLDGVADGSADVLVCYLVLQHLPSRAHVLRYLREFARVLAPAGEAYVQLPVYDAGLAPAAWRAARSLALPVVSRGAPQRSAALRGTRLTARELDDGLADAGLQVLARDTGPDAPYRYATDVFLRLARAR